MKVLLVSANTETLNMRIVPWGLSCVAAAARRAGHDVRLLDLMASRDNRAAIAEAVRDFAPGVIGVSVRNIDDQAMASPSFLLGKVRDVVSDCRAVSAAPIVVGGAGYTIFPQAALLYLGADAGVQGEGEAVFPALLDRLEAGDDLSGLPNVHLPGQAPEGPRVFVDDLDTLPLPDTALLLSCAPADNDTWMPVQTGRGCPMGCTYCSTGLIEGRNMRKRSPGIVAEWLAAQAKAGFHRFFFVDNNFNVPPAHARAICKAIADRGLSIEWRCILNPLHVDEALVTALARAGCVEVSLGFESGSEAILQHMNKKFNLEEVRRSAAVLAAHRIRRNGFLLLGGPGETRESVEASLAFADSLALDMVRVTRGIRIYPHTPLAAMAVGEGMISPQDDLLQPRFYLAKGLEGWIEEVALEWKARRPNWIF